MGAFERRVRAQESGIWSGIWNYKVNSDSSTVTILKLSPSVKGKVDVPEEIDFMTVTAIGEFAFQDAPIVSVTLPATVITIHASAFDECINLKSILLPAGLTSLPANVFRDCSALTKVEIPRE